ncbi:putative glutamine synthetase translation inhibitor GstI-like [Bradyrhizobium sp. ORS 375]|uniref:DUF2735 domain-containing protein n=1 Tax=Bradyrhizobium sp. (strain ORS 375) TaxID=566679 RepID=UPI000240A187|nr:DUF2735 domain-containing protein [Bradyrhizobium sp. ORS 375]CCD92836.1 putative glutamine synthetase translation inhibitor GstI-like [Bradyrhizobium sp. ORS 375]
MDTNAKEGSARIYQFPRGGRAGLTPRLGDTSARQIAPSLQPAIYSGSWYHDEAIQEAKPAWDR